MPVTREDHELWAASRVIAMHFNGDGCRQCQQGDCRMYRWAAARLARWEAEHGRRYQNEIGPAWRRQEGSDGSSAGCATT